MQLIPHNVNAFLESTDVVDADDRSIAAKARQLSLGRNDVGTIRRIYDWVRDEIPHTADLGEGPITCCASDVLFEGTGICYAKSNLLAALLRAIGVPAGFCYQRLAKDPPYEGFELHALNAVYVEQWKRWVRIDARGNRDATDDGRPAVDAEFTPGGEQLAFEVDREKGEADDKRAFAEPLEETIAALIEHETLEELWPNLPSELPSPVSGMPFGLPGMGFGVPGQ